MFFISSLMNDFIIIFYQNEGFSRIRKWKIIVLMMFVTEFRLIDDE